MNSYLQDKPWIQTSLAKAISNWTGVDDASGRQGYRNRKQEFRRAHLFGGI
jgi:hypothetical protein